MGAKIRQKMAKNGLKLFSFQYSNLAQQSSQTLGQISYAHIVKCIDLKKAQNGPLKKSTNDFFDKNFFQMVKNW